METSKNVAVQGRATNRVVAVAKNIKKHINDRYKGFAHCIILFKSIAASMNVISLSFLVHEDHEISNQVK